MNINDWLAANWPWLAIIAGAVILFAQVSRSVSEIYATWGSLWKWFARRKTIAEEKARAKRVHTDAIEKLLVTTDQTAEDVSDIRKKVEESERINQMLLRLQLKDRTEEILDRGFEYFDEIDEINDLFQIYQDHGGNGAIKSRVERIRAMKTMHREEKRRKRERKEREENERTKY